MVQRGASSSVGHLARPISTPKVVRGGWTATATPLLTEVGRIGAVCRIGDLLLGRSLPSSVTGMRKVAALAALGAGCALMASSASAMPAWRLCAVDSCSMTDL